MLLDTNVPSESIRSSPDPKVDAWIQGQDDDLLHLSVITIGELRKGFDLAPQGRQRVELQAWLERDLIPTFDGRILPVTKAIAEKAVGCTCTAFRPRLIFIAAPPLPRNARRAT